MISPADDEEEEIIIKCNQIPYRELFFDRITEVYNFSKPNPYIIVNNFILQRFHLANFANQVIIRYSINVKLSIEIIISKIIQISVLARPR